MVAVPAAQNIAAVVGVPAIVPTPWEAGIDMCRAAITRYTNQIMARNKLFTKMPASDFTDWRKWGQELLVQAKRCMWGDYGVEQATLDALVYQCPDEVWRAKVLQGKLDFQAALNWGFMTLMTKQLATP